MITYREATSEDTEAIAQLHSLSWQQNYRGAFSDTFLDGPVIQNRREVWQKRINHPSSNQCIIVAESEGAICGFACAYANDNPVWGTLLDNLHVRKDLKGQGIGRVLIKLAAEWAYLKSPEAGFYLWVLVQNTNAQKFYDKMGGINQERASLENPDGSFSDCYRYVWPDIKTLL
ncbi:GNAT family N-acetyltransferase [Spirosoma validum]|uniref:GNAT family N-acetyltransferase n=1 Tax=Spirosoma validum TaxID=2771355 RepID=A0A927B415_9BACT|nr:GNAT family N-acetyltransferase [Spirosoma validum]MBD2754891.1 GNAT family N-acetyltransferase [Spirosoma validum]